MDGDVIERDLVACQFGVIDVRHGVEKHLFGCPSCLGDFLTLKREIETADARPSGVAVHALASSPGAAPRGQPQSPATAMNGATPKISTAIGI
jgi:hypothetical protein